MKDDSSESATGGSAATQAVDADTRRWRPRPTTALVIRAIALLLPFVAAFATAQLLAQAMPPPVDTKAVIDRWVVLIGGSTVALVAVDRLARSLLPLTMLLRLGLVFPDRAPSRYHLALRAGTAHQLEERLAVARNAGVTPAEACEMLLALLAALARHDRLTRGHCERVRAYTDVIAAQMGIGAEDRERLHWAALVHDVGKLRVRPGLLNKAGRPTSQEWEEIRSHPAEAALIVEPLRPWLGDWVDAATQHHERFDGAGYPLGLRGHEISLAGRIVAVADAYDCMTAGRPYTKALPAAQARYELMRNSGSQFDPDVVRAFLATSVGRRHLAGGPLAWMAHFPGLRESGALAGGSAAKLSTGVAAAAAAVTAAVATVGLAMPLTGGDSTEATNEGSTATVLALEPAVGRTEPVVAQPPSSTTDLAPTVPTTTGAPLVDRTPVTAVIARPPTVDTSPVTVAPLLAAATSIIDDAVQLAADPPIALPTLIAAPPVTGDGATLDDIDALLPEPLAIG